jgi:drug/metabolite transporter (DMT)-like permease
VTAPASDRRALLVLLAGASLIGVGPILVRLADVGPAAVGFWRVGFALPLLGLLARREGGAGRPDRFELAAGAFFAADLVFWHYAIRLTSVANSTVLSNLTPVVVTVASWLLFRERPRGAFLLGLALAVGGAVLMAVAKGGGGAGRDPHLGDAVAALTAVWYSGYFLCVRHARRRMGAGAVMFWSSLVSAPLMLACAVLLREPLWPGAGGRWLPLLGLGLMHVGGQGAIAWALGRLPASLTSVVVLVQPVVAAALGWLVVGEAVTPLQAAGGAITLGAVVLAQAAGRPRPAPTQEEAAAVA